MCNNNDHLKELNFLGDPALQQELLENGKILVLNKGDVIIKEGQYINFCRSLLKGRFAFISKKKTGKYCSIMYSAMKHA